MSSEHVLSTLVDDGHYFECPRWHDGRWWVSDFYSHAVLAIDPDGTTERVLRVDAQPSGLGWLPDGDLLVVSMKDRKLLRRGADGAVAIHADLDGLASGHPNDMLVRDGHAYVGNFGFDLMGGADPTTADLVHVAPDGTASVAASDLWFPNGMVLADDTTLVVAETFAARLTAFTIAPDGTLHDRRVWAQVQPAPEPADLATMLASFAFAPDGCAVDAEGHVWAANALGGVLNRIAPGGRIVDEVAMPEGLGVFACGLGGDDGRTLLACAAPDFHEAARVAVREAVLLTTTVDVPAG
ncbi:SMP-30/gluconolactonase/LRE family protein [Patulibacter minatonensis]|uniref:SMP-30/gluconolactonase/LRE family protein n=1 Tax=Patulibacter minatonensis TaxID=298163 RepID=UPI00047E088F|nr:SMP-30/gluconolactonase/LRE family protein [Patulibacter minatonensis]